MDVPTDIVGREFAVIIPSGREPEWPESFFASFHLLGKMEDTPYGNLRVYYAGTNPSFTGLVPKYFRFFGNQAGYRAENSGGPD